MSEHGTPNPDTLEPDGWALPIGYAHGMVVPATGRLVVLAGQIGWDPLTCRFSTDDFAGQTRQALANVATLLREAGAEPRDIVRMTWYITDREAYAIARRDIGGAYRELLGKHFPPMSVVVVAGLVEPRALVEIEATAMIAT